MNTMKLSQLKMPTDKKKLASEADMSDLMSADDQPEDTSPDPGSPKPGKEMMDSSDPLSDLSDEDLLAEIKKRGLMSQLHGDNSGNDAAEEEAEGEFA